ncbi:M10 family metallopeptidase C-terminal domain-containing protein [Zavarzinia aquatilis]|uniref:M10 family metallopeptidase C-terminal domain-containing protein n=1 Tax=Zavarzinia aquatilis TaxID=2211142 RepID=UPI001057AA55|nr:M10 family metallopeptidase C-terminal domain-containing protein [Zavarzinia aquatilis]
MAQISNYRALLSGSTWSAPYGELAPGRSAFVTFSFPTVVPGHVAEFEGASAAATWQAFTTSEIIAARSALKTWGDVSGITFLEVKGTDADIVFNKLDFSTTDVAGAAGYAYYPTLYSDWTGELVSSAIGGDVFITTEQSFSTDGLRHILLHEIGHAIGLKHPFESSEENPDTLTAATDDGDHTVMSYNDYFPSLGTFDRQAARAIYGSADGANLESWSWDAARKTLTLTGTAAADTIYGSTAADVIAGGAGDDTIQGRAGNDRIDGGAGNDTLFGGDGNDLFLLPSGDDTIDGGAGLDTLDLSAVTGAIVMSTVMDAAHVARLDFGADEVLIFAVESIRGGSGKDTLGVHRYSGYDGGFSLYGNGGNDLLNISLGNDRLDGGAGYDTVSMAEASGAAVVDLGSTAAQRVGSSRDIFVGIENLIGTDYNDTLTGTDAKNSLFGGAGVDRISGGGGVDRLDGGDGNDRMTGGEGRDLFVWGAETPARLLVGDKDTITDFEHGIDRIDLRAINIHDGYAMTADNFTWIGDSALSGAAGELHYRYSTENTLIEGTLHTGSQKFTIVLSGLVTLDRGDFLLS